MPININFSTEQFTNSLHIYLNKLEVGQRKKGRGFMQRMSKVFLEWVKRKKLSRKGAHSLKPFTGRLRDTTDILDVFKTGGRGDANWTYNLELRLGGYKPPPYVYTHIGNGTTTITPNPPKKWLTIPTNPRYRPNPFSLKLKILGKQRVLVDGAGNVIYILARFVKIKQRLNTDVWIDEFLKAHKEFRIKTLVNKIVEDLEK